MKERIIFYDVVSKLDEDVQKSQYNKMVEVNRVSREYPTGEKIVNHVKLDNFMKSLNCNCLYFKNKTKFEYADEFEPGQFDEVYSRFFSEDEAERVSERGKKFQKACYILPFYDKGTASLMHMKSYSEQENAGQGIAVIYNFNRLMKALESNAWQSELMHEHEYEEIPIVTLADEDRLFCGRPYYVADEESVSDLRFDPGNAVVPLFIKPASTNPDKEYRLCLVHDVKNVMNENPEPKEGIYVKVGNICSIIDSIEVGDGISDNDITKLRSAFEEHGYNLKERNLNSDSDPDLQPNPIRTIIVSSKTETETMTGTDTNAAVQVTTDISQYPECFKDKYTAIKKEESHDFYMYSGKYDSMKQRFLLMRGNRENAYRCYQTSLRYEMLLCGKIALTDAQFYDGMLFTEMVDRGEFDAFVRCVSRHDGLTIRRRCEKVSSSTQTDQFVEKIYGKDFFYSSIRSYEIAKEVESAGKELKEMNSLDSGLYKNICSDISSYWDYISKVSALQRIDDTADAMKKYYQSFNAVPDSLFAPWPDWRNGEYNRFYNEIAGDAHSFDNVEEMAKELGKLYPAYMGSHIRKIASECQKAKTDFINVSAFRSNTLEKNLGKFLQKIGQNSSDAKNYEKAQKLCWDIINEFNYPYNKLIAKQHGCKFLDSIDYSSLNYDAYKGQEVQIVFDKNSLEYIFNCSWDEFSELLDDGPVRTSREQLYAILRDAREDEHSTHELDGAQFKKALEKLNQAIASYCRNHCSDSDTGDIESNIGNIFNENAEIDEYFRTEGLARQDEGGQFIGHGSLLTEERSNDICFYLPNADTDYKMFRICFDNLVDSVYDIVISPSDYNNIEV